MKYLLGVEEKYIVSAEVTVDAPDSMGADDFMAAVKTAELAALEQQTVYAFYDTLMKHGIKLLSTDDGGRQISVKAMGVNAKDENGQNVGGVFTRA
jgi:hypothetical protein